MNKSIESTIKSLLSDLKSDNERRKTELYGIRSTSWPHGYCTGVLECQERIIKQLEEIFFEDTTLY